MPDDVHQARCGGAAAAAAAAVVLLSEDTSHPITPSILLHPKRQSCGWLGGSYRNHGVCQMCGVAALLLPLPLRHAFCSVRRAGGRLVFKAYFVWLWVDFCAEFSPGLPNGARMKWTSHRHLFNHRCFGSTHLRTTLKTFFRGGDGWLAIVRCMMVWRGSCVPEVDNKRDHYLSK